MEQALSARSTTKRPVWIRVALFVAPAVAFMALLVVAVANTDSAPRIGDPAPDFEAELLGGEGRLALADLQGKPVVVNFWASWCPPCKDEAPLLEEASARYGDEIAFVGINIKDAKDDAMGFVESYGDDFQHVRDPDGELYDSFGLTGQPETFFLDENGVILEHIPGPVFRETLYQLLDSLTARAAR